MISSFHWIFLALLAAFIESLKDLSSKASLRTISPQLAGLAASAVPIPMLLVFFLLSPGWPTIDSAFATALVLSGSLNVLGMFHFMRALQESDLSLTIPFISFTPVFLLVTSPLLVGDIPTARDFSGIVCIVGGSYLLHLHTVRLGLFAPFKAIWDQPGPRRMLFVALIYSFTSNFDKMGVQHSSPLLWSLSITTFMTVGFLWLLRYVPWEGHPPPQGRALMMLLLIGVFQGLVLLVQNHALVSGPVPSVIALKRTSILFAVIWGMMFLRETHGRERLAGAILMIIGIAILGMGK
ncbi:MAG: EamA family transporter [Nitrospirales bacterium]|nr:EamA family transporter [Nitrospirales bacterium]